MKGSKVSKNRPTGPGVVRVATGISWSQLANKLPAGRSEKDKVPLTPTATATLRQSLWLECQHRPLLILRGAHTNPSWCTALNPTPLNCHRAPFCPFLVVSLHPQPHSSVCPPSLRQGTSVEGHRNYC